MCVWILWRNCFCRNVFCPVKLIFDFFKTKCQHLIILSFSNMCSTSLMWFLRSWWPLSFDHQILVSPRVLESTCGRLWHIWRNSLQAWLKSCPGEWDGCTDNLKTNFLKPWLSLSRGTKWGRTVKSFTLAGKLLPVQHAALRLLLNYKWTFRRRPCWRNSCLCLCCVCCVARQVPNILMLIVVTVYWIVVRSSHCLRLG